MQDCATWHVAILAGSTDTRECRIGVQRSGTHVYIIIVAENPIESEMWTREGPENWIAIERHTFI